MGNNNRLFLLVMLVVCVVVVTINAADDGVPQFLKTRYQKQFGHQTPNTYSGTKTGVKTTKSRIKSFPTKTKSTGAGLSPHPATGNADLQCSSKPPTPMNAGIFCTQFSGCRIDCLPQHQFPNGQTQVFMSCRNGEWTVDGNEWDHVPACEPICLPQCRNNGICVAPNQCNCPDNYSGPQCQFENKPCLNTPALPMNSRRTCKSTKCTVTCMSGHQFPDGSSIATMICKDGYWTPTKDKWTTLPDCEATCSPPCENGGNCLSFNVCQCPQEFRGPQCQYDANICNAKKLKFNGGYKCTGDSDTFSCSLSCPDGIDFDIKPQPYYTCTYASGVFTPTPIPQCVFPEYSQVIPLDPTSHTFYNISNKLDSYHVDGLSEFSYHSILNQPLFNNHNKMKPFGNNKVAGSPLVLVDVKLPESGSCFTWSGSHYKTFDGKIYSFDSKCSHTLVRDSLDNTFSIIVLNKCSTSDNYCHRIIRIYLQDKEYILKQADDGRPVLVTSKQKILPIPGQLPGLRVKMLAHNLVVSLDTVGVKIKWDGQQLVQVEVKTSLWNRTEGLCGRNDGNQFNDLHNKDGRPAKNILSFANSWKIDQLEDECNDLPSDQHRCDVDPSKSKEASTFCQKLLTDQRFTPCHKVLDTSILLETCRWDYCSCQNYDNPSECACESMNVYVESCALKGVRSLAAWRDDRTCPMKCAGGKVYRTCGPSQGQAVCGQLNEKLSDNIDDDRCVEGCYCPDGLVLHEQKCIRHEECPCRLRGKYFEPGTQVPKDCNTCTCQKGQWICTQVSCGSRCSAIGDPHYMTFDGRRFDFMGQCSYYLVKNDNFSIEAENVACAGSISEAMNLPASVSSGLPSCTKAVTIRIHGQIIKLKQNHGLVVNGEDITKLPYKIADVDIISVSSIFLKVELTNGLDIWWDGLTRVYIDMPAQFKSTTRGLCGTFNNNQKDDFLTPEDDVEQNVIAFANKWKTNEKCNDIPDQIKSNPCDINIQNKPVAEKHCRKIKSDTFADCHWFVDPAPYYQDCLYDMCSCESKITTCLCPIIAAYADECSRKGVKIDWRDTIRECGIQCAADGGQKYQICGNSCTRTCYDIAIRADNCKQQCVEGCNCPEGQTLDDDRECVPISQCKCHYEGLQFHPGYKEVRPASKGPELCTCINALWNCQLATPDEIKDYPQAGDLRSFCGGTENMEFTTCEPVEPVTCKNMHSIDYFSASVCHPGCKCKDGYVLDTFSKKCVKATECPCHHGGKSYTENSTVQNDCNTCKCQSGKWKCTDRQCSGECSAWGDSHYQTFDGKHYDYQGQCDYVLAKGVLDSKHFDVSIQNVPCGTLGTSCSKSITIRVGNTGGHQESITLTRGKQLLLLPTDLKYLTQRQKGIFVIVEAADLGLAIHWDQGTRVYLKIDPRWKEKVKGLCGNYNDNDADDFQTPSGGITEASATLFGDSWKLQPYCPEALEITNTCKERPERKIWATKQCGILKSSVFAPCHTEVALDVYLEKCIFDSCACDQGGDCHCLCTAIAAYAQECNNHGVPIKWRTQQLCPMQCDASCSHYSPCISTCTIETCDNILTHNKQNELCSQDNCIEGCESSNPCPPDQIYLNASHLECVPRNVCKPICIDDKINGVIYYEGDLIEEDECHSCYCSRGQKICKGQPCTTEGTTTVVMTTHQLEQTVQCHSGWSDWINQDRLISKTKSSGGGGKKMDVEPLPNLLIMNNLKSPNKCHKNQMTKIDCRTIKTHKSPKSTGLDVECSLENGLICKSNNRKLCPDFEIRVYCDCGDDNEKTTTIPSTSSCDLNRPHQEHLTDCRLFYHCVPRENDTVELVEKTCGPNTLFNPVTMTCDWPASVIAIKPQCEQQQITKETSSNVNAGVQCPPGMIPDDCALKCDQLCMYYDYAVKESGQCPKNGGVKCVAGCVMAEKKLHCPPGKFWLNNSTCVSIHDCLCRSNDGKPIKPGVVYKENDCELCQCIDNFYSCDRSHCAVKQEDSELLNEIFIGTSTVLPTISTVTPPKKCHEDNYIDLIQGDQPLSDDAFSASSILGPSFSPKYARINSTVTGQSGGSWTPEYSNIDQYLDVNLGRQEPIYGVIVKGSALYTEYVTSYKVLYSPDGKNFQPVLNNDNHPQIFRGSIDTFTPVKQLFDVPFEAEIVRINPQTWYNGISLRVELIGCDETKTTTSQINEFLTTTEKPKLCNNSMGIDDNIMADQQIQVSSTILDDEKKVNLKINGNSYWQPLTNSPTEFIQFDFLEPRTVTGLITKGGRNSWVTAYTVQYSHDLNNWNQIIDKQTMKERVFLGNFDDNSPQINYFDLPISTRLIKLIPVKWHDNIRMRVEVQGCFIPYPTIKVVPTTTVAPGPCNYCPGISSGHLEVNACQCNQDKWWDGENCVTRAECPCMIGHIPYAVGAVFEKDDCSQCICKLGGLSHCTPKQCNELCEAGLKRTVTKTTCQCICEPCPADTILCPTSNICINSTLWCNGVHDCPDDEVGCTTTTIATTTTTTEKPVQKCPEIKCQPGYKVVGKTISKAIKYSHAYASPMFSNYGRKTVKSPLKTVNYDAGFKKTKSASNKFQRPVLPTTSSVIVEERQICPEYVCQTMKEQPKFIYSTKECPPIVCPLHYIPIYDILDDDDNDAISSKECPKYSCSPPPPPDAVCNVNGRTFNTFDKTEYKYDICNHVLARDLIGNEWDILLTKNCRNTKFCARELIVRHQQHLFVIDQNLTVEYDGYRYTIDQTKKIGTQTQAFTISQLGNAILFVSNRYGFWIIWTQNGNLKLGVVRKLAGHVDGLCGYFNDNPVDDKRKPNGDLARTTVDFGDSWLLDETNNGKEAPLICSIKTCPTDIQNKAWEMCNKVKDQILAPCARVLDIEAFISRCLETTCECLETNENQNHTADEECRCATLQSFVVDCLTTEPSTDLGDWRMQMDCPVTCEPPLVYHDCYQRKCEPTCQSINDPTVCPKLPNVCFPGCYCPVGFVKKDDTCIKPSSCRDCECNVLPHLQYVTYDDTNFTINGDCVYVMSRDVAHKFQVLITNTRCKHNEEKSCVGKVTILYQGHKIHVLNDYRGNKLRLIVDGEHVNDFIDVSKWLQVRETATKHFKILLADLQVEISVYFPSLGVSVKAPSHKYGGKLEGLCGNCNGEPYDDLRKPSGVITDNIDDFGVSWLYEKLPQNKDLCHNKPKDICLPLPIDSDPCTQLLLDVNKFGQCLRILDPTIFVEWCKKDTCNNHPELGCQAIEAYARDCANAGFCINWRNQLCPAITCKNDQIYDPCGSNCPKSCDSIKSSTKNNKKHCTKSNKPVEGCFCPDGKVFLNDTCVIEKDCEVCDDQGHHPGDKWQKDKCTTCRCDGLVMNCQTKHCPGIDKVCDRGYTPVKVPTTNQDECCDKYACLPEPTVGPTCETPQQLQCGKGQIMKLDTKPNGCQQFICECKPIDDCDMINQTTIQLEPGYIQEIDNSGCCPELNLICKTELCPTPQECPQYYTLKNVTINQKCCPLYTCEPPKDKCIYETEYIAADNGGERVRNQFEKQKILKNINDTWNDGPCHECKCLPTTIGNYQSTCTQIECAKIETSQDYLDYQLEEELIYDQCCPNIKRVACKYENEIYQIGAQWTKPNDLCTMFECVNATTTTNGPLKETRITSCERNCDLGYEYFDDPKQCCGSCKAVACVVDGIVHKIGDEWESLDYCTKFFCLNINGSMQVQSVLVNCPELPEDYVDNFAFETISIDGECCKKYKPTGCKVGDKIYRIGDIWPSATDKCKNYTCLERSSSSSNNNNNGELVKQESIESCKKDCAIGWQYKESNISCCGECVQIACIIDNNNLRDVGEIWLSSDNCTTFTCEPQFILTSQQELCQSIDDCLEENIYVKGCCKYCNVTSLAQVQCSPESIASTKTVGLVKASRPNHGQCLNKEPIKGFTECVGSCHSSTFYNLKSGFHENDCTCCQATKYEPIDVELECEDGYKWLKKVAVPTACGCEGCAAVNKKDAKKMFTKTG